MSSGATLEEDFRDTICKKHSASFDLTEMKAPQQAFDYSDENVTQHASPPPAGDGNNPAQKTIRRARKPADRAPDDPISAPHGITQQERARKTPKT